MAVNKVKYGSTTLIDLTDADDVSASDIPEGVKVYGASGNLITGTKASGGGGGLQAYQGYDYVRASSYTATDVTITVAEAGTYKCSWMGWRNTTSGTSGSQLYKNGSAVGSAHTTFTSSYGQYCEETLTFAKNDVLVVRARARNSSYYMYVGNLIIEKQ